MSRPAKRRVEYDGRVYTVRSNRVEIPDLASLDRFSALIWLNQNTYATGPRSKPNSLAGFGDALTLRTS